MNYQTYRPHSDLSALVKCYWTLEVPFERDVPKQRILPDGCIELFFILGDDVRRFTSDGDFILQPRHMVLGQITEPFFIQPTGDVNTFAVRFYPYGFANFISTPIGQLANKETPIELLFDEKPAKILSAQIIHASGTANRIEIIESFLLARMQSSAIIHQIVESTVATLLSAKGSLSVNEIIREDPSRRRQLERAFSKQIGLSPKQLGKVIRLQAVLKMLLAGEAGQLTQVAYEHDYHDQAHFIKDFKEFTGTSPKHFLGDESMALSALLYSKD